MSLSREVFLAQKAELKARQEQEELQLREQIRQAQAQAELDIARISAESAAQRQAEQQNIVDAQVAQVNALTNAINQRQQASAIRFGARQDELAVRAEAENRTSELAQQERAQQRQVGQAAGDVGQAAARAVAQQAGTGGVSSQTNASIRGDFTSLAQELAGVNRDMSGTRARSDAQAAYERRLMGIQSQLADTQARSLEMQASVNQELQTTVAQQNEQTARDNRLANTVNSARARSAVRSAASAAEQNYAQAIRNLDRQTRDSIRQARRTLL